jgi:hypothetical protein
MSTSMCCGICTLMAFGIAEKRGFASSPQVQYETVARSAVAALNVTLTP